MEERRYMNTHELAAYLRKPVGSVRVETSRKKIPHVKLGRRVIYDRIAIDEWLASKRVSVGV